jgi:hypothetical protein
MHSSTNAIYATRGVIFNSYYSLQLSNSNFHSLHHIQHNRLRISQQRICRLHIYLLRIYLLRISQPHSAHNRRIVHMHEQASFLAEPDAPYRRHRKSPN